MRCPASIGWAARFAQTLYRNYVSIEAAQHHARGAAGLQLAERDGRARDALPARAPTFMHWMDIEDHDFTEAGEPELAHDIEGRGRRLFDEIAAAPPQARHDQRVRRAACAARTI